MAKKKLTPVQKFIIIGGSLIVILSVVLLIMYGQQSEPKTFMEALEEELDKRSIGDSRKQLARVQLAIQDYQAKHEGKPPQSLNELVPEYFLEVPVNPDTGKPYDYSVVNGAPRIVAADAGPSAPSKRQGGDATTTGDGEAITAEEQELLIASLNEEVAEEHYIYDPTGKRDPFRPFDLSPKQDLTGKTPLERYDLGQLKLTAVLNTDGAPTAIVENAEGRGFTVRKGTKIGANSGEVVEILPDKLLILETTVDFTNTPHTNTVELRLRSKAEEQQRR